MGYSADLMNAGNGHQHRTTPYLAGPFSIRRWWRRKGLRWPQFPPDSLLEGDGFELPVPRTVSTSLSSGPLPEVPAVNRLAHHLDELMRSPIATWRPFP
jgi:hypothetical protein